MFQVLDYKGAQGHPLRYGKLTNPAQAGNGKAMLYVPGLGGSVKGALDYLELMSQEYGTIYGPDLRGFGLNPIDSPLTGATIIPEDLEAFYQQVIAPAGPQELVLCGISLGGVLAALMATAHPERFSKLILLAPAFKPHKASFSLTYTIRATLDYLIRGDKARTQLPYGLDSITNNATILADPQYSEALPLELTPGFLLGVRALSNKAMADIKRLNIPTLMVIPGQDLICDPQAMRQAYERIPASTPKQLNEYPDFYHDVLFEEDHPQMTQEIMDWALSLDSRATSLASR